MNLKSDKAKEEFRYLYCAICLYFSNALFHSCSFIGGNAPMIGFHSVMERPEPVNRVMPPNKTCTMIMKIPISNHIATGFVDRFLRRSFVMRRKVRPHVGKIIFGEFFF